MDNKQSSVGKNEKSIDKRKVGSSFQPLDPIDRQIRLFRLIKNGAGHIIKGVLEIHDLDTAPPFQALSYTWGSSWRLKTIHIDGRATKVRRSLYHFLVTYSCIPTDKYSTMFPRYAVFAKSPFDAYLWVDQLCIDQTNISERNDQVSFMNAIYKEARHVVAWLGKHNRKTAATMDIITANTVDWTLRRKPPTSPLEVLDRNTYWHRVWIVQELLLARDITVLCGYACLQWRALEDWFYRQGICSSAVGRLIEYRKGNTGTLQEFDRLIDNFCGNKCSDPRDKVYGLLGLLGDERVFLTPRYEAPVEEVFNDVAKAAVRFKIEQANRAERSGWNVGDARGELLLTLEKLMHEMGISREKAMNQSGQGFVDFKDYLHDIWREEARLGIGASLGDDDTE